MIHAPRFSDLVISRPHLARDLKPGVKGLVLAASINLALLAPVILAPFVFIEGMRPPAAPRPYVRIDIVLPRPNPGVRDRSPWTGKRAGGDGTRRTGAQAAVRRSAIPIVPPVAEETPPDPATTAMPGDPDQRTPGGPAGTGGPGDEGVGGPGGGCCGGQGGPGQGGEPGDGELWEWNEGLVRPVLIPSSRVQPRYPDPARKARVGGTVVLAILIGPDGRVGEIEVLSAPDRRWGFDWAAVEAVGRWRYQPGLMIGRPVAVRAHVTVEFILTH